MQSAVDVSDVKICVSSHYGSPTSNGRHRRSTTSSNTAINELDPNGKSETSPNELPEIVDKCEEKPVIIPIQDSTTNNDDHTIDGTKPINDMVTMKNECNDSANRQSSVKKKGNNTNVCDVLWHSVSLVAWPAIDINTIIQQQVVGVDQMMVTTETQTDIIDCDVANKKQDCAEIIL